MEPFKLILETGSGKGKVSLHMIGPKEIRILSDLSDHCAPPLGEPNPEVAKSMLKLGAITESSIPFGGETVKGYRLTDLGKAILQLKVLQ